MHNVLSYGVGFFQNKKIALVPIIKLRRIKSYLCFYVVTLLHFSCEVNKSSIKLLLSFVCSVFCNILKTLQKHFHCVGINLSNSRSLI